MGQTGIRKSCHDKLRQYARSMLCPPDGWQIPVVSPAWEPIAPTLHCVSALAVFGIAFSIALLLEMSLVSARAVLRVQVAERQGEVRSTACSTNSIFTILALHMYSTWLHDPPITTSPQATLSKAAARSLRCTGACASWFCKRLSDDANIPTLLGWESAMGNCISETSWWGQSSPLP